MTAIMAAAPTERICMDWAGIDGAGWAEEKGGGGGDGDERTGDKVGAVCRCLHSHGRNNVSDHGGGGNLGEVCLCVCARVCVCHMATNSPTL